MKKKFGERLRQARRERGLTLATLAERSGVSRAALSKIERGERTPSLTNALQIAESLATPLAALIGQSLEAVTVTRQGEGTRMVEAGSNAVREALLRPYAGTEVVCYTLPARAATAVFPAHEPGTRECFVLLSGRIEVVAGDHRITLAAGDAAALPVDCAHQVVNRSDDAAVYVLLIGRPT